MASASRSATAAGRRLLCARRNPILRTTCPNHSSTSELHFHHASPRVVVFLFPSIETMLPLHSAISSARLRSSIAVDATCWSWLSRDFAVPR